MADERKDGAMYHKDVIYCPPFRKFYPPEQISVLGGQLSGCIRHAYMEPSVCQDLDSYLLAALCVRAAVIFQGTIQVTTSNLLRPGNLILDLVDAKETLAGQALRSSTGRAEQVGPCLQALGPTYVDVSCECLAASSVIPALKGQKGASGAIIMALPHQASPTVLRHLAPRLDTLARAMAESFGEAQAEILRIAALFLPPRTPLTCPLALSACFVGSGLFLQGCSPLIDSERAATSSAQLPTAASEPCPEVAASARSWPAHSHAALGQASRDKDAASSCSEIVAHYDMLRRRELRAPGSSTAPSSRCEGGAAATRQPRGSQAAEGAPCMPGGDANQKRAKQHWRRALQLLAAAFTEVVAAGCAACAWLFRPVWRMSAI